MNQKLVSQLDETGLYIGPAYADESPLEEGVFHIPRLCVEVLPMVPMEGKRQRYVDGIFVYEDDPVELPPVPGFPTFGSAKALKLAEINSRCELKLSAVKFGYPEGEVQSWSKQEQEARAYGVDSSASTPFLSALAAARGIPLSLLAEKVIEKADLFAAMTGTIIGKRQYCEDLLNSLEEPDATIEDVAAITWPE
jgi:hypothetical protein